MVSMMRSSRLATGFGVAFLAIACMSPAPIASLDAEWSGQDPARVFDFNAPLNWKPNGVPTGTATISAASPAAPFVQFTQAATTLGAINLTGGLGITIDSDKTVTASKGGLSICCDAKIRSEGVLNGNVVLGSRTAPQMSHQLDGSGTINGDITQTGGSLHPGVSQSSRTLTVNGAYTQGPGGALIVDVYPDGAGLLVLSRTATVGGALLIGVNGDVENRTFKILTAAGVSGRFLHVYVIEEKYSAIVTYNARDITVSLRRL